MVGLSHDAMAMWCNVSMQPVIDAYNMPIHLNMSVSTTCPSDEIKMLLQSKNIRYCHLVALLMHSKNCHIPNSVLSYLLSVQLMSVGPMTVNATAARIVKTVQSFYETSINHTLVTRRLIMTFSNQFSVMLAQSLNPEAQRHWCNQLQSLYLESR